MKFGMKKLNVLITSAGKQLSLSKEIIKELKGTNADKKVYTCDMNPESVTDMVESDGCFKVPICTSEDYVETMFSLCLGYDIGHIITMTEREFIILSANKDIFRKYGIQVVDYKCYNGFVSTVTSKYSQLSHQNTANCHIKIS